MPRALGWLRGVRDRDEVGDVVAVGHHQDRDDLINGGLGRETQHD